MVSEKKIFLCFSHDAPGAGPLLDPRGTVGRIYKEDHYTLLQTKYESSRPCGCAEEDFFLCFTHDPPTKYESSRPCGFAEEDFFMFYP